MSVSPLAAFALALPLLATQLALAADPPLETFPTGRSFAVDARPAALPFRACSFTRPVCAHAAREAHAVAALGDLERAYDHLHDVLALPPPEPDAGGGSSAFDVYLGDEPTFDVGIESVSSVPFDRAAAFARVGPGEGSWTRFHLARALATSMLLAVDGGANGESLSQKSAYLAWCVTGISGPVLEGIDRAQRAPEAPLVGTSDIDAPSPSVLLPWLLDHRFGSGPPGRVMTLLTYGEQQRTPAGSTQFHDDPDMAELVRRLARAVDKKPDDVYLDLAMTRAFLGQRDDGLHEADGAFLGAMGRVKFDTTWKHAELPRRLSFTPLAPTGAAYVWIDLRGAPPETRLGVVLDWEGPGNMRWATIRIDDEGRERSRIELTTENGIRHVEREISNLGGTRGLLVVGTNLGDVTNLHPHRQAEAPYEPHGGTLHVFKVAD